MRRSRDNIQYLSLIAFRLNGGLHIGESQLYQIGKNTGKYPKHTHFSIFVKNKRLKNVN